MRKLLLGTTLPLLAVCLSLHGVQASQIGVPVPKPTATGQSITSSTAAPFTWTPVTLPYGLNGAGQMAVGGTVDAASRLSVNPQGAAENGLTVNMPSGATGTAIKAGGPIVITLPSASNIGLNIIAASGQSADMLRLSSSTLGTLVSFHPNGDEFFSIANSLFWSGDFSISDQWGFYYSAADTKHPFHVTNSLLVGSGFANNTDYGTGNIRATGAVTAKGYASSVRSVTATDTATLTDSVLLCNGTFTETLPATGWPTGYRLTVKDTGTGTITLTAGGTVTFDGATTITFATQYKSRVLIFDGANFQVESGLL